MKMKTITIILMLTITLFSCKKEIEPVPVKAIEIGAYHEGGIIFWINPADSTKGMACAVKDQSDFFIWGCYDFAIENTEETIGKGKFNTDRIVSLCTEDSTAVMECNDLILNGKSDWFLPSVEELGEMVKHKVILNATALENNGEQFADDKYWSSSEWNNPDYIRTYAIFYNFEDDKTDHTEKNQLYRVRAVRAF